MIDMVSHRCSPSVMAYLCGAIGWMGGIGAGLATVWPLSFYTDKCFFCKVIQTIYTGCFANTSVLKQTIYQLVQANFSLTAVLSAWVVNSLFHTVVWMNI